MDKLQDNRYLPLTWLEEALEMHGFLAKAERLGESEESRPIYALTIGNGPRKVLAWSQMHGNETTSTKSLLDFLEEIAANKHTDLLHELTLRIIPMLNPDGAEYYTRVNANGIDLNREAITQTQKESQLLVKEYHRFQPDLCLNLHGQRTIFSAGAPDIPASLSFLAPSYDEERSINPVRTIAMAIIAEIAASFPDRKEWGIGRYDDGFNLNCMGDYFMQQGTPTILFEAGHFPGDYFRNHTRSLIHKTLTTSLYSFAKNTYLNYSVKHYFNLPENKQTLRDIELLNVTNVNNMKASYFFQFKEVLEGDRIVFVPERTEHKKDLCGLKRIDFSTLDENITNSYPFDDNLIKWIKMFVSMKINH